jgi:hypothetical protein
MHILLFDYSIPNKNFLLILFWRKDCVIDAAYIKTYNDDNNQSLNHTKEGILNKNSINIGDIMKRGIVLFHYYGLSRF